MEVRPIQKWEIEPWLLFKHYAKRMPSISYAFGLYENKCLIGVCCFGLGGNTGNNMIGGYNTLELQRLCVNDDAPKNSSSFLVGNALKMLPSPMIIVSYADQNVGHVGYIYQATNWIYTGLSGTDHEFLKDGRTYHRKGLFDRYGTGSVSFLEKKGFVPIKQEPKHRYFYLIGNRREKRKMMAVLPHERLPYPKGDTRRYDASFNVQTQSVMF